ncbi:carbohydrate ABC transporter permease [Paramicrobacterium sp. CJ85]|uniref:carbohydrate ABC transporter permease n=1 Tax=Paramicrobacterium sp. CJ85 TaxID=3445355 RepID=UPI003F62C8A4
MTTAVRSRRTKQSRPWISLTVLAVAAVLVNIPLMNALFVSFRAESDITTGALSMSQGLTLDHYANALGAAGYEFPAYFVNSAMISVGTVVIVTLVSFTGAYAIVRLGLGGRMLLRAVTSLRLLPAIAFVVPFFMFFSALQVVDTVFALILANVFLNTPIAIMLMTAGLQEVPKEVEEAAMVDGCSVYRTLFSVVWPLMAPTASAVAVLTFIFSWADYLFAVILSSTQATPVTVGAANFVTSTGIRWGDVSAITVLSILPPMIFGILARRQLVAGLSAGAVK